MIEPHGERVELRLPVLAVAVEPQRGLEDRPGVEPAPADPAGALLLDEAGADKDLDVARHRLQRNVEPLGELRHQELAALEMHEDRAPHRIGQRREHLVEHGLVGIVVGMADEAEARLGHDRLSTIWLIINHTVDYLSIRIRRSNHA